MLIVDSGPLIAVGLRSDIYHEECARLLAEASPPLVVPEMVVTEVAYFLLTRGGPAAEAKFAASIADREFEVEPVAEGDWVRLSRLVSQYVDLPLGMVDASVIVLAERYGATEVATLDRRHFSVVRPRHVERLRLLPDG